MATSKGPGDQQWRSSKAKKTSTSWEVEARRRKVLQLRLRGRNGTEIAHLLGTTTRVVYADLEAVTNHLYKTQRGVSAEVLAVQYWAAGEERKAELWSEYESTRSAVVRLGILKQLGEEDKQQREMLQSLGIVYKAPESVMVWNVAAGKLASLEPTERAALVALVREGKHVEFRERLTAMGIDVSQMPERVALPGSGETS